MSDGRKNNGGKRKGAGRKPKAYTQFKRRLEQEKIEDADYAFWLHTKVMQDDEQSIELRLQCADWIANRVLGKPKERAEISGEVAVKAYVGINPDDWNVDSKPEP